MSYEIFNEDCLEGMKRIPDGSVDMILTDLPYNLTDCAWDKSTIDLAALWAQFKRILKPYCAAVLFASGKFTHKLIASNFEWFKYKWIWVKNAPTDFVNAHNRPMRKFEEILVFTDGVPAHKGKSSKRMKYNPQGLSELFQMRKNGGGGAHDLCHGISRPASVYAFWNQYDYKEKKYLQEQTGYPSDVLYYDAEPSTKKFHPTQKPVDLLEYLIKTYTNEGETVLDATMGSGSTGVACVNTDRNFIGFETEKNFYDISQKRIDEAIAKREQSLF